MISPLLALLSLLNGVANTIGGRADDVFGAGRFPASRAIFRCIVPAVFSAAFALFISKDYSFSAYVLLAVGIGSAMWFPWGWSFDEITGQYSAYKYPLWMQKIGLRVFFTDGRKSTNRKRGILLKGIRGSFDIFTFALLSPLNPWIMLLWLPTFSMGLIYWICGKIFSKSPVAWAEFFYGTLRFALIGTAIILAR